MLMPLKLNRHKKYKISWPCLLIYLGLLFSPTGCTKDEETSITDIDGNIYSSVTIGTQTWMAENLKTTRYNDRSPIPLVKDELEFRKLTTPAYCWYHNNETYYKNLYGALYNWYSVKTGKLCPTGWHVPTDTEFETLADFLGGREVAGGKLKEAGTRHWKTPNTGATNEVGFTALPGGFRNHSGLFNYWCNRLIGYWWTSSEKRSSWHIISNSSAIQPINDWPRQSGFSVRCIMDQ